MIFKRFFTWIFWAMIGPFSKEKWIALIIVFGPLFLVVTFSSHVLGCTLLYYSLLAFGSIFYCDSERNWRLVLDKIEKRAKELGIPEDFKSGFNALKDEIRKSQNPDKLKEFIKMIEELKDARKVLAGVKQKFLQIVSNEQWIDEKVAKFKKELKTRLAKLPHVIETHEAASRAIERDIWILLER
ncbi:MAG: hypothetical protein OEW48_13610 [Phycisphaerae bacterium]|nr:hypothetical protein [Phycisphaerae bacterium]